MTKAPTKKTVRSTVSKAEARQLINAATAPRAARKQALEAEYERAAEVRPDPQSGMDPATGNEDAERRVAEQFRAADAVGQPRTEKEQAAVEEATLNRQIRGY